MFRKERERIAIEGIKWRFVYVQFSERLSMIFNLAIGLVAFGYATQVANHFFALPFFGKVFPSFSELSLPVNDYIGMWAMIWAVASYLMRPILDIGAEVKEENSFVRFPFSAHRRINGDSDNGTRDNDNTPSVSKAVWKKEA